MKRRKDIIKKKNKIYTEEFKHQIVKLRGSEFKNDAIQQILDAFGIQRSLSAKGSPHDNAVAESI
ncbi:MAG: hypothetical protein FWF76_02245 [Oscillospiraceae bacterium]|nr:hypothetical protein [Oscillospiraceae bacterium]